MNPFVQALATMFGVAAPPAAGRTYVGTFSPLVAPGPVPMSRLVPAPPPTQAMSSSSAVAQGQQVAMRQRARMATPINNGLPTSVVRAPRPVLQANTVAGGY